MMIYICTKIEQKKEKKRKIKQFLEKEDYSIQNLSKNSLNQIILKIQMQFFQRDLSMQYQLHVELTKQPFQYSLKKMQNEEGVLQSKM